MKIKRHISLSLAILMLSSLASCSDTVKKAEISTDSSSVNSSNNSQGESTQEKKENIILTMAMSGDPEPLEKAMEEFNESDNGYQVQIKRYGDQSNDDGTINDLPPEQSQYKDIEILQDIMNTTNVDIVCNYSFGDIAYYNILQNKGAFVDLYTFMENDSEVNTDTLDTHILNLNEIDNKLYTMPTFYSINSLYGESQYVGTKENWTFDEFVEHWNAMPPDSTLMGATDKDGVFNVVLRRNLESYVDYENVKVNFDSPDFRRMLKFCNQFELNLADKATYNYDAPSMLAPLYVTAIMSAPMFNKDNGKTCVGYPSIDGNGAYLSSDGFSFSICASSSPEKQKAAWEFIRTFVAEEWQIENAIPLISGQGVIDDYYSTEAGYCVNKNAFDTISERLINKEYYSATFKNKDIEYERRFPNEEDVKELRRYINSVNRWENGTSRPIYEIVVEEASAYFAGGQTIDETIEHIQNRASIWVSEQS
ncbi:MAG: extracellular solute-binding protein [Ruminococcus sp.]|nr:extracellular solute-binding protein [Ruminococcus sp.]